MPGRSSQLGGLIREDYLHYLKLCDDLHLMWENGQISGDHAMRAFEEARRVQRSNVSAELDLLVYLEHNADIALNSA